MSEYDMQLARGVHDDGWTNLAIGEPYALQDNLQSCYGGWNGDLTYPASQGDKWLLEELQDRYPDQHIVVANGGKQALLAALEGFSTFGYETAHHTTPYWPSFRTLAHLAGLGFTSTGPWDTDLVIATIPNNPNGYDYRSTRSRVHLWDAAYAHPVYGFRPESAPEYTVKVESASKLFGLSSLRVGWLVTNSDIIYQRALEYVEMHTSGVSVPAQQIVADYLRFQDRLGEGYEKARRQMLINADIYWNEIGNFAEVTQGVPDNGTGMFAWFKVYPEIEKPFQSALEAAHVRVIRGEACGMPGWIRMSMAHRTDTTFQALRAIKEHVTQHVDR